MKSSKLYRQFRRVLALSAAAVVAGSITVPTAAIADDPYAEVRAGYSALGMSQSTIDALIGKLEAGQPVDALIPDAEPVSESTFVQVGDAPYAEEGSTVSVRWYADGSPAVTAIEEAVRVGAGGIVPFSVQGCSVSSGSGYSNYTGCTVSAWWGTVQSAFRADFTLVQGGYDRINNAYNGWQQCAYPTTCSAPYESQRKAIENASGPATSRWQQTVTASWGSWEVWIQLRVGGDSYSNISS